MTLRQAAYRYLNLMRNADKRRYGFAYLTWLQGGATGMEPDRGRLSVMGAQAVRMGLHEILGDDPFRAVRENSTEVKPMAGQGQRVTFHGAFGSAAAARKKHKLVPGSYVRKKRFKGQGTRWMVLGRGTRGEVSVRVGPFGAGLPPSAMRAVSAAHRSLRRSRRGKNPLTQKEAGEVLKAAQTIYRGARKLRELTAPEIRDPKARVAARAYRHGEADAMVRVARAYGPTRRRERAAKYQGRRPRSLFRRPQRGFRAALRGEYRNAPAHIVGAIPGRLHQIVYNRPKGKTTPGGMYEHTFGPGSKILARSDGSLLIKPTGKKKLWEDLPD